MIGALARLLGKPLAKGTTTLQPADAIVVLGGPLTAGGRLSSVVEERLAAAVALWKRGAAPLLCVAGGRTRGAELAEAEVMAGRARDGGVPDSALLVESSSSSTYENALNVARLLLPTGRRRVIVVTTPFHLRRGVRWFARAGFVAQGWLIRDSLQYREPRRALRWIAREYGSWLLSYWISLTFRYRTARTVDPARPLPPPHP